MAGPYHHPSAEGAAPIRIEIAWTRKSLASFMARYYMTRRGISYMAMALIGPAILIGLHFVLADFSLVVGLVWLAATPFRALGYYSMFKKKGEMLWDKNEIFQHPMTLTFSPATLEIAGHDRRIVRSLNSFRGLEETGRAFWLTMSPDAFYVIPKSAFADETQRKAFRELVRGGIPKSSPA